MKPAPAGDEDVRAQVRIADIAPPWVNDGGGGYTVMFNSFASRSFQEIFATGAPFVIPDYQRGHVWTQTQQVAYIEAKLRRQVPHDVDIIRANCPAWSITRSRTFTDLDPETVELVDGLQRITAIQRFMRNEIGVFGGYRASEIADVRRGMYALTYRVNSLTTRADVIRWYLQLNTSGTPHSADEIERVRGLLAAATVTR